MKLPLLAVLVGAVLTAGCQAVDVAPTSAPAAVPMVAPPVVVPIAPTTPVLRVVDGDTFDTTEARVRVLVMDSCERGTDGGPRATADARELLEDRRVTLTAEPSAPDRDRYGRLLRYVALSDGRDYAETMLAGTHTAVYDGRSDASDERMAAGREADADGRTCEDPEPTPAASTEDGSDTGTCLDTDTCYDPAGSAYREGMPPQPDESSSTGEYMPDTGTTNESGTSGEAQYEWGCAQGYITEGC